MAFRLKKTLTFFDNKAHLHVSLKENEVIFSIFHDNQRHSND
jgi:hypothetical protein